MGIISYFCPYKTHITYTFCGQPISSPYHVYNYSYLMHTNFIGSSYMSDVFAIMLPVLSCIGVVLWVLYLYFCLECINLKIILAFYEGQTTPHPPWARPSVSQDPPPITVSGHALAFILKVHSQYCFYSHNSVMIKYVSKQQRLPHQYFVVC